MNSIIISISKGLVARNLLQNDFYSLIKDHYEKVVIVSTAARENRFIHEFKADNVEIVQAVEPIYNFWGRVFEKLFRFLVYNKRTEMMARYNFHSDNDKPKKWPRLKYWSTKIFFLPFSRVKTIRKILRYLDYLFLQKEMVKQYQDLIKKYKPKVVFATAILDDSEVALVKAARRNGIKTIAMSKSWDNPSKMYFRAKADVAPVWSNFMQSQIKKYQDYKDVEIPIVGIPQFDYYLDKSRLESRQDFCQRNKLDPSKKIIFFGSEGKLMPSDSNIVRILIDLNNGGKIENKCQIFVRPHFAYDNDRQKFAQFVNEKNLIIDNSHQASKGFSDGWDYSIKQMNHFLNAVYHSDLIILTASTLALDAAALGKPIVFIKFDGHKKNSQRSSVAGWYTSDYYGALIKHNPGLIVENVVDLKNAINAFFKDPDIFFSQQKRLLKNFCHKIDGRSGERLFKVVAEI